jgi:hypothetical protein
MWSKKPQPTLADTSFDDLLTQKLAIEDELGRRSDTELALLKEKLELIARFKGVEIETVFAPPKKERKKREFKPRKPRVVEEVVEEPIAA